MPKKRELQAEEKEFVSWMTKKIQSHDPEVKPHLGLQPKDSDPDTKPYLYTPKEGDVKDAEQRVKKLQGRK